MYYIRSTFFIIVLYVLVSCGSGEIISVPNDMSKVAQDSTGLVLTGCDTVYIGSRVTPLPYMSMVTTINGKECYAVLDENRISFFSMDDGSCLSGGIDLTGLPPLKGYSGFYYVNPDSIFVYNYKNKTVSLVDSVGKIRNEWSVRDKNKQVDIEALSSSPMQYAYPHFIMTGATIGHDDDDYNTKHISALLNLTNNRICFIGNYPNIYSKAKFGGLYMNQVYQTMACNDIVSYSFPAEHYVYNYSLNKETIDSVYMGSRYANSIESAPTENNLKLLFDKDSSIRYFISQHSYANLLFDKYRKIYYRIALHPLKEWTGGAFLQPFSIIVISEAGSIITETPIFKDYYELNLNNIHVSKSGLKIQKFDKDEDIIVFNTYTLYSND